VYGKADRVYGHMILFTLSLMEEKKLKTNEEVLFVHKNGDSQIDYLLCPTFNVEAERGLTEDDLKAIEKMVENKGCKA